MNGVTVYEIEPGNGQKISFTVANSQLLFAVGGSQLEQALRNDNDVRPLSDSDDFKAVSGHFPDGALNTSFVQQLRQIGLEEGAPIYFLCRSGVRSAAAAAEATAAGLGPAYNVSDGFEGPLDRAGSGRCGRSLSAHRRHDRRGLSAGTTVALVHSRWYVGPSD